MASLLIIQTATLAAIMLTLIVYYGQLRAMRQSMSGQHFLALVQFLQAEEIRSARTFVITELKQKDFSNWSQKDREKAASVCASYGTAGVLVRTGLVDFKLLESWEPSVKACFEICRPMIQELRTTAGPKYWIDFDRLYDKFIETTQ